MSATAGCFDCGRPYGDEHGFPDLIVPDEVWRRISPTGDEGGLLCPSCMVKRAVAAGVENVEARFRSGPFAVERGVRETTDTEDTERWRFIRPFLRVSSWLKDKHANLVVRAVFLNCEYIEIDPWDYGNPPSYDAVDDAIDAARESDTARSGRDSKGGGE